MRRSIYAWIFVFSLCLVSCRESARSTQCFDDIRKLVEGRTSSEVRQLLGEPDSRETMILSGERWVWWNYTYLDGKNYPPEERGQVVHLEILFERIPAHEKASAPVELLAAGPMSVTYAIPTDKT